MVNRTFSVTAAAREAGDDLALVADDGDRTWLELAAGVEPIARRLEALGVRPGARVAFDAHPTVETVARLLACFEIGACAVPLHTGLPAAERARRMGMVMPCHDLDTDPTRATEANGASPGHGDFTWDPRPHKERRATLDATHAASTTAMAVLFTSGSGTGEPRAVELSPAAFAASARMSAGRLGWRADDRWLCCLPLAHVGGLSVLTRSLAARRTVVLGRFDAAETARLLRERDVTLASLVPTMLRRLLDASPDGSAARTLRAVLVGGASTSDALLEEATGVGLPVLPTYGMTEACSQVATARHEGSAGLELLDEARVRIVDGVIEVAGPMLCDRLTRSVHEPSPWRPDGFLRTGDRGRLVDGVLEVFGRADDVIVTGGENVDPAEVERVLARHPRVRRAVVFGIPDPEWGQVVGVALDAADDLADAELSDWLRPRLAGYQLPRRFFRPAEWPSTPSGKLDRRAVASLAEAR